MDFNVLTYLRLARREPELLGFGILHAFLSSPGQTFFIALFTTAMAEAVGIDLTTLGLLYLSATLVSASILPLLGQWIDRIDLRLFAGAATAALAAACFIMGSAASVPVLWMAIVALRLTGQGLMVHVEATATARFFGSDRGKALAITAMGLPVGEAVLPALATISLGLLGWHTTYVGVGMIVLLAGLPLSQWLLRSRPDFTRVVPAADAEPSSRPSLLNGIRRLARARVFWLVLPLLLYFPLASTALLFHIRLIAEMGNAAGVVASAFVGYALAHAAGLVASGPVIDRVTARRMMPALILPMLGGTVLCALYPAPVTVVILLSLTGLCTGFNKTMFSALWAELFGFAQLGAIRSAATTLMVAGTAAGPVAFTLLVDGNLSLSAVLLVFAAVGGLASAMLLLDRQQHPAA